MRECWETKWLAVREGAWNRGDGCNSLLGMGGGDAEEKESRRRESGKKREKVDVIDDGIRTDCRCPSSGGDLLLCAPSGRQRQPAAAANSHRQRASQQAQKPRTGRSGSTPLSAHGLPPPSPLWSTTSGTSYRVVGPAYELS